MTDDIIDEIDRLHSRATHGEWFYVASLTDEESMTPGGTYADVVTAAKDEDSRPVSVIDGPSDRDAELIAALKTAWPAIRDRLRRAERCLAMADEALALKEQLNETLRRCCDEAKRKARAFDAIEEAWADNRFDIYLGSSNADGYIEIVGDGADLLTAIEHALRGEEKSK
jgi:hypothetical protein